ncbi:MAG: alcohol dehydrogenase catalytic domain-containing protein [Phycisphaerae bacterium]|nr:alcohol dehydrogenase catalytic domain-containing protein [Phycisphaerae bacterium]
MKAIRYYAPHDVRVESIDVPACGADEIRIRIDACAVCGTDLKAWRHGNPRIKAPIVMGHEFTGIVETVGSGVGGFSLGERIVMATSISCGRCDYCRKGWSNLCADVAPMGFSFPGGMAEYTTLPARAIANGHVVKAPAHIKPEHAALAEPLSCAVNCAANCNIRPGDVVVVVGAGPMGIMNACVAKMAGAAKVILAEINPQRLAQAEAFAFDVLINPARDDLPKIVKDHTGGLGADVAIVAAPAAQPQAAALELVRKRGTVCLFASLPADRCMLEINSRLIHYGEITLTGTSDSTPGHVAAAVDLIASGKLPADKLATHTMKLEQIVQAFELMESGEALRVVLKP